MRFWEWRHTGPTHHLFPTPAAQILCWEAVSLMHTACGDSIEKHDVQRSDLPRCRACQDIGVLRDQAFELFAGGSVEHRMLWGQTLSGRGLHLAPASPYGLCGRLITRRIDVLSISHRCVRCIRAGGAFFRRLSKK